MTKTSSGPTRIHNKRQQKIVSMVDGYDSTATISAALRNVLLVWVLPGVALVGVGLLGLLGSSSSSFAAKTLDSALISIRFGSALLSIVTLIVSIVWSVRTWSNIRRVGKRARIGVWDVIKRHLTFLGASIFLGVLSIFMPGAALLLLVLAGILLFLAFSVVPFLVLALVRLFWRTGSPPTGQEEELPHYGIVWFSSWFVYNTLAGSGEYGGLDITVVSLAAMVTGVSCVVAAVTGSRLVMDISRRHDERLATIVGGLDLDQDDQQAEVTSRQIESAWADSEALVSFDH